MSQAEAQALFDWAKSKIGPCPDVDKSTILGWLDNRKKKNDPFLGKVRAACNRNIGCPDLEIGYLMDLAREEFLPHMDEDLLAALGIYADIPRLLVLAGPKTLEMVFHELTWFCRQEHVWELDLLTEGDCTAALDLLVEDGVIARNGSYFSVR